MLEEIAKDYAAYIKLDVNNELNSVQEVVDNMLTRLEELTSVLQIIKTKNTECSATATEDICKYRSEITILVKKLNTLTDVMHKVQQNMDILEKKVEKAEIEFGINNDNKIISFLKPFLKKRDTSITDMPTDSSRETNLHSILDSFTET